MVEEKSDRSGAFDVYTRLLQAWNDRDASAYADLFGDDGNCVGFDGSPMDGRGEVEPQLQNIFDHHPTAAYVARVREIRTVADGVVLLRAVAGMIPPGEDDVNPDANAIQTLVVVRRDHGWQVALFQNTPAAFHGRPEMSERLTEELTAVARTGAVVSTG